MRRRIAGPARLLTLGVILAISTGCESLRSSTRKHADGAADEAVDRVGAVESEASKVLAVDSDAKNPTPFFKNNRLSGALSDEGREIERNLGVR